MHLYKTRTQSDSNTRIVLFVATFCLATIAPQPLKAQLCSTVGANGPCILTQGYAGPPSDANFNSRQNFNGYEPNLTPSYVSSMPTTSQGFLEVDDSLAALPNHAPSNPIMAQPLYVAGISVLSPAYTANCNPSCNMLIAVTLNDTVWAWNADTGGLLWNRKGAPGASPGTGNALWYDDCGSLASISTRNNSVTRLACLAIRSRLRQIG